MQWRVSLEAIDPIGDDYRQEFRFEKCLDGLFDGEVGCSLEDGKVVMANIQRIIVEREIALCVMARRQCKTWECFKLGGQAASLPSRSL